MQNSYFRRNVVVQPGPLTRPPKYRSLDSPSFRIIDFGRAQEYNDHKNPQRAKDLNIVEYGYKAMGEMDKEELYAKAELRITLEDFDTAFLHNCSNRILILEY